MPDSQTHLQARPSYYPVPLYPAVEEQGPQEKGMAANPPHANGTHAMGQIFDGRGDRGMWVFDASVDVASM